VAVVVWAGSLITITVATVIGYWPRTIKSLPNPVTLYEKYGAKPPVEADTQVIGNLGDAWATIVSATATKSTCLIVAIGAVVAELAMLVALSAVQLLR
jgi:hypothetical protein